MQTELSDNLFAFVTAGHALFTLEGAVSRYTYRVSVKDGDPDTTFVSVLTGPDNGRDYTCIARLLGPDRSVKPTRNATPDTPSLKAFVWTFERLRRGLSIAPVRFWHHGKCCRCGRVLTTPESIARGIGPECATKL